METIISSASRSVTIGPGRPTVLIGERINPTGRKRVAEALRAGDLEFLRQEALAQVEAGADLLDVNVGAAGVDEVSTLRRAVQMVQETVDVPLCLDSANPAALEAALAVYKGKALVNSVNGEPRRLSELLPLVRRHGAAVIGMTMDATGIPSDPLKRLAIAREIVVMAERSGIAREDVIVDCLAMAVGAEPAAALATLEAIRLVAQELGVNQTLGASNVSFGLPDRRQVEAAFLGMAILNGVKCPIVDVAGVRPAVLAIDVLLGRDEYASRFVRDYRRRAKAAAR